MDEVGVGALFSDGDETSEMIGFPQVVAIEQHNPVRPGKVDGGVACGGQAPIFFVAKEAHGLLDVSGKCVEKFLGAIMGAVFNEDEFPVRERLGANCGERGAKISIGPVSRHADTEQGDGHRGES